MKMYPFYIYLVKLPIYPDMHLGKWKHVPFTVTTLSTILEFFEKNRK